MSTPRLCLYLAALTVLAAELNAGRLLHSLAVGAGAIFVTAAGAGRIITRGKARGR